jgi:hypothetical protein
LKPVRLCASIIICIFFIAAAALSAVVTAHHAEHECKGDICVFCIHFAGISKSFKFIAGSQAAGAVFIFSFLIFFIPLKKTLKLSWDTPVSLKVRMNN